ncbi:MAG: type I-C CRISPR-associated protein Cas8c/Csd1, partial [Magnetococcales bacterium]|nr:type I-C CRISPR-associated protein Cas8c/Csd1 [Magnetococcales bacterium]
MSWIHKLYDTHNYCSSLLPPLSHTTQQAHIEIILNSKGHFRRALVVPKKENDTLVPCTEASGGRTGITPKNHPLCDKLQYVAGDFINFGGKVTSGFSKDPELPHRTYIADLASWASSSYGHSKLDPILTYVKKGKIVQDLIDHGILLIDGSSILNIWTGDKKDIPPIFKVLTKPQDAFVRWRVESFEDQNSATWQDDSLIKSWIDYYSHTQTQTQTQTKRGMCMVTGNNDELLAVQHPAKLRNAGDKAKLISSNDSRGYTFLGRFLSADEACGVGIDVSQKVHITLRWLIQKQGYRNGDQVIVSWATSGVKTPNPIANTFEIFSNDSEKDFFQENIQKDVGQAFSIRLSKFIAGYQVKLGSTTDICVIALDSATPGRMAIVFYRELKSAEFLNRVHDWHRNFAWHQNYGKDKKFIGSPSPRDIAEAAYGRR